MELQKLQQRVDGAIGKTCLSDKELNSLLQDLARAGETTALVRIWDLTKSIEEATWCAVNSLHKLGKGKIPSGTLNVVAIKAKKLAPARRLHKICKGRAVAARNKLAAEHLDAAMGYISKQQATGRNICADGGKARRALAKELAGAIGVNMKLALALVTKLKQKRALVGC